MTSDETHAHDYLRPYLVNIASELAMWADRHSKNSKSVEKLFENLKQRNSLTAYPKEYKPDNLATWGCFFGFAGDYYKYTSATRKDRQNLTFRHLKCIRDCLIEFCILSDAPQFSRNYEDDPKSWEKFLKACVDAFNSDVPEQEDKHQSDTEDNFDNEKKESKHISNIHRVSGPIVKISNIPPLTRFFSGRDEALADLNLHLLNAGQRVAVTAMHGLRGVGKTTLAAYFATQTAADYKVRWWLRAEQPSTLNEDLIGLGVRCGWVKDTDQDEAALKITLNALSAADGSTLLIFDNAIDASSISAILSRIGGAHIIITSNSPNWGANIKTIEVDTWSDIVGGAYLVDRLGPHTNVAKAEELSRLLGGLPLALEQAATYCYRCSTDIERYMVLFKDEVKESLDDTDNIDVSYHSREEAGYRTVWGTVRLVLGMAAKEIAASEELLIYCALCASDSIPKYLFEDGAAVFGELATSFQGRKFDKAVATLRNFSLIYVEDIVDERIPTISTKCIRLHRLVREIAVRSRENDEQEKMRRVLALALAEVFPEKAYHKPQTWPVVRRLSTHVLEIINSLKKMVGSSVYPLALLTDHIAEYEHGYTGNYAKSVEFYRLGLEILGDKSKAYLELHARLLHGEGWVLTTMGSWVQGTRVLFKAFKIGRRELTQDNPIMIDIIFRLGWNTVYRSKYKRAECILLKAKELFEKSETLMLNDRISPHGTVAWLYSNMGRYDEAVAHIEFEMERLNKFIDPGEPIFGAHAHNLGTIYFNMGRYEEAKTELARALRIRFRTLSRGHSESPIRFIKLRCYALQQKAFIERSDC